MRTGAEIIWKPILLGRVLGAINPELKETRFDPDTPKARYQAKSLNDWANFCGLTISIPSQWPEGVEMALRGAVVAAENNVLEVFSKRIYEAYFGAQKDISQSQVIVEIAAECGLDRKPFKQKMDAPDTLYSLQKNSDELVDRGGFGCPTMFIGEDMYFGNDQMPVVEMALAKAGSLRFVMPGQHG
jgi:2-hydroxychromene-2-carboxylate isomerase